MSAETTSQKTSVSRRIDGLSPEKRLLLDKLLRAQGVDVARLTRIPRRGEAGPLPLSFAQQRLWFLDQLEPGNPFYNITAALFLHGTLNVEALGRSIEEMASRHESLRTVFETSEGKPSQVILPTCPCVFSVEDLCHVAPELREAEARRLIGEESLRPFDLARGPLLRAILYRLGREKHALLLAVHHIVSDAVSMATLVREVAALYEAFATGRPSPLAPLPIQYGDYAVWQRDWLAKGEIEGQLAYWREQLKGAPPVLELPTDRPRPAVQHFDGAAHHFRLPKELTDALVGLGRREGATLFMTLLAGFDALLYRYTSQEEILVGTPVAGRTRAETEPLIGFFVNTLVLRSQLRPEMSFRDLLAEVRRTALSAYANQDVPFDKLVEELQPERDLSRTPLFQVMFTLQNAPAGELKLPGLSLEMLAPPGSSSKFDLELILAETEGGELEGLIEYSTALFDADTIARMAGHYARLLSAAAADPDARLPRLPLLTEGERRLLLSEWNDTARDYPSDSSFNQLFAARVAADPDAVAVRGPGGSYTYARLDRLASRVARAVTTHGVGREQVVALLCERTEATVAGVVGLLRSGAAYLPLDSRHPAARHRRVLDGSGARLVIAGRGLVGAAREAAGEGVTVLDLDALLEGAEADDSFSRTGACADAALTGWAGPRSLAYVIYTSGSTGSPKGAMVEQRGLLNHLLAKVSDLALSPADVVAQTAPLCFDISVWQMLAPLCAGGRVEVIPDEEAHDPRGLSEAVGRRGVTVLEVVPSLLRLLAERLGAEGAGAPAGLRWLLATGEALPAAVCRAWLRATAGRVPVVNAYGPTECSDDVTHEFIGSEAEAGGARLAVGRALANTRLYVTGAGLEPAPVGVAGELLVGGAGVGRGYLGAAALTAERFIPDPFSGEAGARLYRTGDLVRYLADGRIDFLGRLDHQVKVRGHRIEPGEIEAALLKHETVKEAVVVTREGAGGDKRLVAYVTVGGGGSGAAAELRAHLKELLPEYMVPSAFVVLDALPLTPNGKVDRKRLPEPEAEEAAAERYVGPRNEAEGKLAEIWSEVLGVERVGVEDNFFELGGHSLLATQLMSRVLMDFGVQVGLRRFFEEPTVAGLALAIVQEQAAQTDEDEMAALLAELDGLPDAPDGSQLFDNIGTAAD